jgi:hypothetical protein
VKGISVAEVLSTDRAMVKFTSIDTPEMAGLPVAKVLKSFAFIQP